MKDFRFSMFNNKYKLFKYKGDNIITIKKMSICFLKDFSCKIKKPLSIKERNKTGSFRFLTLFSKNMKK